jgi:hypothetical protein
LGRIPNPLISPLTTYNTAQGGFDEVLREILQKVFIIPYYGEVLEMPNNKLCNSKNFTVVAIIQKSVYNYGMPRKEILCHKMGTAIFLLIPLK